MIDYLVKEFGCDRKELEDLLSKEGSFVLQKGEDFSIFSKVSDKIVEGHYAFKSRGKKALEVAKEMISEVFDRGHEVILGRTPHVNKKARWFSRQLGFQSISDEDTYRGKVEVFMLKKGSE